jgi:hypothetical protein
MHSDKMHMVGVYHSMGLSSGKLTQFWLKSFSKMCKKKTKKKH